MATTFSYTPGYYMAANSDLPVGVETTYNYEDHFAIINALFDSNEFIAGNTTPYSIGNKLYTKVTLVTAGDYVVGDVLYLDDPNNVYFGTARVVEIISSTVIVLDFQYISLPLDNIKIYRTSQFKSPIFKGKTYFNLVEDLSRRVEDSFQKTPLDIYDASSTKKKVKLSLDEDFDYLYKFEDNYFLPGGKIGFNNTSLSSVTQTEFVIGDQISVQQDLFGWTTVSYDSNAGSLRFIGDTVTQPPFRVGQQIQVVEASVPAFVGTHIVTEVDFVSPNYRVTVNYSYSGSPVGAAASLWGMTIPEYNGFAEVTNITVEGANGLVIHTNRDFVQNTPAIGGTITYANGSKLKVNKIDEAEFEIFQGDFNNKYDYTNNNYEDFILHPDKPTGKISTILSDSTEINYINRNDRMDLLVHFSGTSFVGPGSGIQYKFYNAAGTLLGDYVNIFTGSTTELDFYCPSSITDLERTTTSLSSFTNSIDSYTVQVIGLQFGQAASNIIKFKLADCSRYEKYSIAWRDLKGSLISYPFNLLSRKFIETDNKEFYKDTGKFEGGEWSHGLRSSNTVYFGRSKEKLILNSDWVDEYENYKLIDMMNSPQKFINIDGELFPCTFATKQIEDKKSMNDQIFNYTFEVVFAWDKQNR